MMIDNEVSFTSLCYITVDYEGRIWLNRFLFRSNFNFRQDNIINVWSTGAVV